MLAKSDFRTSAEEKISAETRDRTWTAIKSLTDSDLQRLKIYARWKIRGLGHLAAGREDLDLLHEAIAAIVDGRRPWREEKIPFFAHLFGAMRSISNAWWQKAAHERRFEINYDDGTDELTTETQVAREFLVLGDCGPNPETIANHTQIFEKLADSLAGDATASKVLKMMMDDWQDRDIPTELGISRQSYEAAKKRVQRRLQKIVAPPENRSERSRPSGEVP